MTERTTVHETIVVERDYGVPLARVFTAFSDAKERARWDVPGDGWELAELHDEFKVGGRTSSRFGPKGDPRFYSDGVYLAIEPNVRIVSAGTMHERDKPVTCTLGTIELYASAHGTRLVLTDQSAYFGSETSKNRRGGWGKVLDNLQRHLAGRSRP